MFTPFGFYEDFNPGEILWLTTTPVGSDQDTIISNLIGFGFKVTVVNEGTGPYDANNYQAVCIHEDVNSSTAWNTLSTATRDNTTAGVVIGEQALFDEFLGGDGAQINTGENLTMTITPSGETHPITKNYAGSVDPGNLMQRWQSTPANGTILSTWDGDSSKAIIVVYDIGQDNENNVPQNGRRVTLPVGNQYGSMNSVGEEIWVRAIRWAAGDTRL